MMSTKPGNGIDGYGADSRRFTPNGRSLWRGGETSPEQNLMAAVLCDAINCYVRYGHTPDTSQRRLHNAAARWISNGDIEWPYSFENICTALDLDAATIRRELHARGLENRAKPARTPGAPSVPRSAA